LDQIDVRVTIQKQGNKDGTYLFGHRIIRPKVERSGVYIVLGSRRTELGEWIHQNERTEQLRQKGLVSAAAFVSFLSQIH